MNLCDVIEGMGAEKLADWERLWVEIHPGPPPKTPIVHPFIYEHPTTARKVCQVKLINTLIFNTK